MQKVLAYILLFATLLPAISPWGTIAYYQVNKDYIARVLCINRDKPQLHCDGKCYLAKKLKDQRDKQDKETTERAQHTPIIQLFCLDGYTFHFAQTVDLARQADLFSYLLTPYTAPLSSVFHPPGTAC